MASRAAPLPAALLCAALAACSAAAGGSIGVVLGRDNDSRALFVRDVPPGLAGDRAGLLPGDEIIMIDGVYVRDLTALDVRARLRGEVGTPVELTVVRGNEVRNLRVVRGELLPHQETQPKEEKIEP